MDKEPSLDNFVFFGIILVLVLIALHKVCEVVSLVIP